MSISHRRLSYFSLILIILACICSVAVSTSDSFARRTTDAPINRPRRGKRSSGASIPTSSIKNDKEPVDEQISAESEIEASKELELPNVEDISNPQEPPSHNSKPRIHETNFVAECNMPTALGDFRMRSYTYNSPTQKLEPIVMIYGDVEGKDNVIVRVHDQCFTSEVFGSMRCDCREQLQESLKLVRKEGGMIIYLQQEGRGIGISNKVAAYSLQDAGLDTVDANLQLGFKDEMREYMAVPDILDDLNVHSIRLVTNNPFKISQLKSLGVSITERIQMQIPSNKHNVKYLLSKRDRMNHYLGHDLEQIISTQGSGSRVFDHQLEHVFDDRGPQPAPGGSTPDSVAASSPAVEEDFDDLSDGGVSDSLLIDFEDEEEDEDKLCGMTQLVGGSNEQGLDSAEKAKGYAFGRHTVEAAIAAIREGKIVIVVDDEDRENEGDLIMASEKATPETVGFIVRYSSGVLCVSLDSSRLDELNLPPMVVNNEDPKQTAYAVSVDYKHDTSTGISASDRAACFRALADPNRTAADFQRPGHVFPLRYKPGGVLARAGHTEASLDLSRLAGLYPSGVLAEVVNDDGSMMRLPGLKLMAAEHGMVMTSVQDLIAYRRELELVESEEEKAAEEKNDL